MMLCIGGCFCISPKQCTPHTPCKRQAGSSRAAHVREGGSVWERARRASWGGCHNTAAELLLLHKSPRRLAPVVLPSNITGTCSSAARATRRWRQQREAAAAAAAALTTGVPRYLLALRACCRHEGHLAVHQAVVEHQLGLRRVAWVGGAAAGRQPHPLDRHCR